MPRYFFNVEDGAAIPDLEGTELPDLNAARIEATRFAGAILQDEAHAFQTHDSWRLDVCDELGLLLFSLRFDFVEMPRAVNPD